MIKTIRMLGNGATIMIDEDGSRKTVNVFADHVKALVRVGAVNKDTELFIPYHTKPIKVSDWFNMDGEQTNINQLDIFDVIKKGKDNV